MSDTSPPVHNWLAGDAMNAARMNEIAAQMSFLRNPPMVHVQRALTAQTITTATWNFINFDTVVNSYDPYDMFDAGTPNVITAQLAGWYTIEGSLTLNGTGNEGRDILGVFKNTTSTTDIIMRSDVQNQFAGYNTVWTKEHQIFLNVGDTIYLGHYYDSDASRTTLITGGAVSRMRARWVSN